MCFTSLTTELEKRYTYVEEITIGEITIEGITIGEITTEPEKECLADASCMPHLKLSS